MAILNAKLSIQKFPAYHVIGSAIKLDIKSSFKNCADNNDMMLVTVAPNTLRIPISFPL